jgi:hypothetical protein
MEINRLVYKNHRIIEFDNESIVYKSTFKIFDSSGKIIRKFKSINSKKTLNNCINFLDSIIK